MRTSRLAGFIIDCQVTDLRQAAEFWGAALRMDLRPLPAEEGGKYIRLVDPEARLHIEVQTVSHPSRVHLDIEADDVETEVVRLEGLGARRVAHVQTWWVMEAPTGQRFCVVPRQASVIDRWHGLMRTRDMSGLDGLLADTVVFESPALHTPQPGKAMTRKYLEAANVVLNNDTFRYVGEWRGDAVGGARIPLSPGRGRGRRHRHDRLERCRADHALQGHGAALQGAADADDADGGGTGPDLSRAAVRRRVIVVGAGHGRPRGGDRPRAARRGGHRAGARRGARRQDARVAVDGAAIDGGPTVFTMRWVFDGLLRDAGHAARGPRSTWRRPTCWRAMPGATAAGSTCTPTSSARPRRSASSPARPRPTAIVASARSSRAIYRTLQAPFIDAHAADAAELARRVGLGRLDALLAHAAVADAVVRRSARTSATRACGSCSAATRRIAAHRRSRAPATLMLVAHVEQDGVWLVRGGMHEVALALAGVAERHGARAALRRARARRSSVERRPRPRRGARGRRAARGGRRRLQRRLRRAGRGPAGRRGAARRARGAARGALAVGAHLVPARRPARLSAGAPQRVLRRGLPAASSTSIFGRRSVTARRPSTSARRIAGTAPTPIDGDAERLLVLVNAPADGDLRAARRRTDRRRRARTLRPVAQLRPANSSAAARAVVTDPADFERLFPATGGALYGRATHGPFATFARPGRAAACRGCISRVVRCIPGPGVPMATMSGRRAAECVARRTCGPLGRTAHELRSACGTS